MSQTDRAGLSAVQLALVFLSGVAVCAVFFALGFVVARNQTAPAVSAESSTEEVPPPAPAPTPVNRETEAAKSESTSPALSANQGGIVVRNYPAPNSGLSGLSASVAASPVPPARVEQTPPKSTTKPPSGLPTVSSSRPASSQSAMPAAFSTQSAASPPAVANTALPAPSPGSKIVVQVSAVGVRQDGDTLVNLLKSRGYPAFVLTPEAAGLGDKLFRVQVGPYKSDREALAVRDKLVKDGFKPFVRH